MLAAIVRPLVALLRALDVRLDRTRLPEGAAKSTLLRAIGRAQSAPSLRGALHLLRLSPSRYHQWRRAEQLRELDAWLVYYNRRRTHQDKTCLDERE